MVTFRQIKKAAENIDNAKLVVKQELGTINDEIFIYEGFDDTHVYFQICKKNIPNCHIVNLKVKTRFILLEEQNLGNGKLYVAKFKMHIF